MQPVDAAHPVGYPYISVGVLHEASVDVVETFDTAFADPAARASGEKKEAVIGRSNGISGRSHEFFYIPGARHGVDTPEIRTGKFEKAGIGTYHHAAGSLGYIPYLPAQLAHYLRRARRHGQGIGRHVKPLVSPKIKRAVVHERGISGSVRVRRTEEIEEWRLVEHIVDAVIESAPDVFVRIEECSQDSIVL